MKKHFYLLLIITLSIPIVGYSHGYSVRECIEGVDFILDTYRLKNDEDIPKEIFLEMFLPQVQSFSKKEQEFLLKYINVIWSEGKTGNQIATEFLNECMD